MNRQTITEGEARTLFPVAFTLLDQENAAQLPKAKFDFATMDSIDDGVELSVWYSLPDSSNKLWALVIIPDDPNDTFIEEYYEREPQ